VLNEGFLPRELCLAQLPSRLKKGDRQFECTYSPLIEGETLSGLLIVANEVTEKIRRAQEEAEQREMLSLFEGVMRDRLGYLEFADEAGAIIEELATTPPEATNWRRLRIR
jgi:hypothetical protein